MAGPLAGEWFDMEVDAGMDARMEAGARARLSTG